MSNDLIIPDNFGPVAEVFKESPIDPSTFTAGIGMAWPILTLRGKEWGWRFRGQEHGYVAPDAAAGGALMPMRLLDVVLVAAGTRISKVYYDKGFVKGERTPPTCWSANGVTPDPAVPDEVKKTITNRSCRACKWNVFGSKVGDGGQKGKACSDNKRLAVVTLMDLQNLDFGGPFMLRLPPGSFQNYTTYCSVMGSRGYPVFSIVTRMMFEQGVEHPKVAFMPVRPLTPQEAAMVIDHQKNPRTMEMLDDQAMGAFLDPDAEDDAGAVGELPTAANDTPPPAATTPPVTVQHHPSGAQSDVAVPVTQPVPQTPAKPTLTPAQQQIEDLKAKLAEAEKAAAEPEPPPPPAMTPEQLEIQNLKAKLAEAEAKKPRGRPRTKPVGPPTETVTATGNGAVANENPPSAVGNAIADRIAGLVGQKA